MVLHRVLDTDVAASHSSNGEEGEDLVVVIADLHVGTSERFDTIDLEH